MKNKLLPYVILPLMAIVLIGAGTASAHGWFGMGRSATPQETAQAHTTMFQQQADLLGISVDEAKNAWAQGKNLRQLAQEKGISQDQLQQKMLDLRKQQMKHHLQDLVSQGVITQSQADQRSAYIDQQTQQNGKGSGRGHGRGMMGMGF